MDTTFGATGSGLGGFTYPHDLCIPPGATVTSHYQHPDSARFHAILAEVGKLHDQKQRDYGTPQSPFANLEASEEFGVPPWLGIMVRMNDKMSRLKTFAKTRTLANESVIDNANDLAVYAIALRIAFEKATIADPVKAGLKW